MRTRRYRGYSGSFGHPSETALRSDARALFQHVHARHPDVIVVGRSLGSLACEVVRKRQLNPCHG